MKRRNSHDGASALLSMAEHFRYHPEMSSSPTMCLSLSATTSFQSIVTAGAGPTPSVFRSW